MAKSAFLLRHNQLWRAASKLPECADNPLHIYSSNSLIQNAIADGQVAEISGRRSCGRTSLCLHILAQATGRGEVCAVVDMQDSFHPASAQAAGVALEQIVWVRCQRNAQHTMRTADLLLHTGGFGVVLLDLCEASPQALNRIPLSYWYRLRRAVEHTPTTLLVCADSSEVKCSLVTKLSLKRKAEHWTGTQPFLHFQGWESSASSSKTLTALPELLSVLSVA